MTRGAGPVLEVRGVGMEFATDGGVHRVLDGVDVAVDARETVALVGESGWARPRCSGSWRGSSAPPPGRSASRGGSSPAPGPT